MTEYSVRRKPCDLLLGRGAERSMRGQTFQQREGVLNLPSRQRYNVEAPQAILAKDWLSCYESNVQEQKRK